MSTDPQSLVGERIGQFQVEEHIARGGMADVYLAEDVDLRRKVAIKVMLPALISDDEFVSRFQREARTVAQLEHPNIVQVYSIGTTPGERPYIAMQYVEGESLQERLRQLKESGKLMPTAQALGLLRPIADALHTAHQADVVHRDLKPSNILIRSDEAPVLVDLGIAAVQSGPKLTRTGTLIGTPHYMSPEQAKGQPADERSDIYAMGVVLYEMLAGRPPFVAEEPMAVLHAHVYEECTPIGLMRADLAPETEALVSRCLQKDPAERLASASELVDFIDRALRAEGGGGEISSSGVWRPQPTSVTPISRRQVLREPAVPASAPAPAGDEKREKAGEKRPFWHYALIPLLALLLSGGAWLIFRGDGNEGTETAGLADLTAPATRFAAPGGATAAPATSTAAATLASLPTRTSLPTLTPLPTLTSPPPATDTPAATATPSGPSTEVIGYSARNNPIEAVRFGDGPNVVVLIGGLHAGAAPGTVTLANRAIGHFSDNPEAVPAAVTLYVIPSANPDSPYDPGELAGRLNANGVDLNRNWDCEWVEDAKWRGNVVPGSGGPSPFSEPETVALRDFLLDVDPVAVVFWEALARDGLSAPGGCNGRVRVSATLAQRYGVAAGYRVADFEDLTDQELNGDGTNWLDAQGIPAIAVLLPDYTGPDWFPNLEGIEAVLAEAGR